MCVYKFVCAEAFNMYLLEANSQLPQYCLYSVNIMNCIPVYIMGLFSLYSYQF